MFGFYRVATVTPVLKLASPSYNVAQLIAAGERAREQGVQILLTPELSLTGYTCGDLFLQEHLLLEAEAALQLLIAWSSGHRMIVVVGLPAEIDHQLYNLAAVVSDGRLHGLIAKSYLPNYREFYDKRWFSPAKRLVRKNVNFAGQSAVPCGIDILFRAGRELVFGVEICEDLWVPVPPSINLALNGAGLLLNLSASNELIGKADYRRQLVAQHSARIMAAYVYVSSGVTESTTDTVFGGQCLIAENGAVIAESERLSRNEVMTVAELDLRKIAGLRRSESGFGDMDIKECREVLVPTPVPLLELGRRFERQPFVPSNPEKRDQRCEEVVRIQAHGLAQRLAHTGLSKAVIGISGGLDSALALLVTHRAFGLLNYDPAGIIAITMPGFGTTTRTRDNALILIDQLGSTKRAVDITAACLQHFKDIGHDPAVHDVTYENVQARERTQILMDTANRERGLVIGTGDLSEVALGWSTYNGDHISMYSVNCGVPKTLVKHLINWFATQAEETEMGAILRDILATPVSPELLPVAADGKMAQHTESILGPYELHDFFLYHVVRYGAEPKKVLFLAQQTFAGEYPEEEIKRTLKIFYQRFFSQQFKRSCFTDGPKVGTVALSPRADWRMPSDASATDFLRDLD